MEGRSFAERLTYSGVNMQGQFELDELEQLHKFLVKEITLQYGAPAAVKILGKALVHLEFGGGISSAEAEEIETPTAIESRSSGIKSLQGRWRKAHEMLVEYPDMWVARGVHLQPLQRAIRRRWNARMNDWNADEDVMVKLDDAPFGAGAMRECFAMKKLSSHTTHRDWKRALNLVAKRYKNQKTAAQVYYDDVKLQMDAKLLGDLYNSCNPPKKVDFITAQLYEIISGPVRGLFCVESLIEGEYLKHNSNSGFVEDEECRNTPQAFSHWSFHQTNGNKIVVDIQGVGDLYTDPQIHTRDGEGYGTGNLGARGMALFFRGHKCNAICHQLGLEAFPRCTADLRCSMSRQSSMAASSTKSFKDGTLRRTFTQLSEEDTKELERKVAEMQQVEEDVATLLSKSWQKQQQQQAPLHPTNQALVHFELAKLHGEAVLLPELHEDIDLEDSMQGGLFHLFKSAFDGCRTACCVLARVYNGVPPSLSQLKVLVEQANGADGFEMVEDPELALMYTKMAADIGVRGACFSYAAQTSAEGPFRDYGAALKYYQKGLDEEPASPEQEDEASALPGATISKHEAYAAMANIYMEGGPGLPVNSSSAAELFGLAAEAATDSGKGKLAAKYFELQATAEE